MATKTLTTATDNRLYWNERGRIACANHAPYKGSDTWEWERWTALTARDHAEWLATVGSKAECESQGAYCVGVAKVG